MENFVVVIMAAGKGTRMNNPEKAKVMYELNGSPLISFVINLAKKIKADRIISILGFKKEIVSDYLKNNFQNVEIAIQEPQLGTGHAIMQTEKLLQNFNGNILILSGDVPLLKVETIQNLLDQHLESNSDATILTALIDNPTGYGRIIRNDENRFVLGIVEEKDANPEVKKIKEINSGIYIFKSGELFKSLKSIKNNNAQNEYYLTDVFADFWKNEKKVNAIIANNFSEIMGINTIEQLNEAENLLKRKANVY